MIGVTMGVSLLSSLSSTKTYASGVVVTSSNSCFNNSNSLILSRRIKHVVSAITMLENIGIVAYFASRIVE